MTTIAYLAPELPALSGTFVYEELLGLERRGFATVPVTVRRPAAPAREQDALSRRTTLLYDAVPALMVLKALALLPTFGWRTLKAAHWLAHDMMQVGLSRAQAWKLGYQWLMGARLARTLKTRHCDHLHVHFAHTPAQIGMYASAFSGVPFTVMAHANDIFQRGLLLPEKAQRAVKMLTISRFNLEYLRSQGVPEDRMGLVRCGIGVPPRSDRPAFGPRPRYRVGTLCRLVEKKGVDDLLRAAALLEDVELRIAGDGPLRTRLEGLARELGIAQRVRFEGPLRHDAVGEWLRSLDAFAMACKPDASGDMDGIPVALMEAMSQRIPVVSTSISGIPELIVHERTGLLAAAADPSGVAQQIRRLLGNAQLCERLTDAALEHLNTEFAQDVNLHRLIGEIRRPAPLRTLAGVRSD